MVSNINITFFCNLILLFKLFYAALSLDDNLFAIWKWDVLLMEWFNESWYQWDSSEETMCGVQRSIALIRFKVYLFSSNFHAFENYNMQRHYTLTFVAPLSTISSSSCFKITLTCKVLLHQLPLKGFSPLWHFSW